MIERLHARNEWKFAGVLEQADRPLALLWWMLVFLRGLLPDQRSPSLPAARRKQLNKAHQSLRSEVCGFEFYQVFENMHEGLGA